MAGRFDYVQYDETAQAIQAGAKQAFEALAQAIEVLPKCRAQALALTHLEESYMWVGKAIRDSQIARGAPAPLQESRVNS